MENIIGILGGDLRNVELAKILKARGYDIKTYDLFDNDFYSLEDFLANVKYIIAGTPFSRDGDILNSIGNRDKISIERFFESMSEEQVLFAGSICDKARSLSNRYNITIYDLLDDEEMAILNAIPSAEGAIEVALKSMKSTLHSANSLILGYGRIGKVLASILKGFSSNIYIAARKEADLAWIKAMGYIPIRYNELNRILGKMDVVFNTVPFLVLKENELECLDKRCVLIDLASRPGGIDFEKSKELKLETYWALGLPGKVAPRSVATYMADMIERKI